ncbi:MAG: ABC transporter ATP-binding protein, partial [Anaerolineales bacterium]|nr:ABC transporter ATP-binding protein [Anaerolineales bacterium]
MLQIEDLHVSYGAIEVLRGITFSVPEGKVVALIGPNGAGKSTTLNAISGLVGVRSGRIQFNDQSINNLRADQIAALRLVQVPEGREVLAPLSVAENLELGAYVRKDRANIQADLDQIYGRFPRLAERRSQLAGSLSGGEQQMLAIGRALMARPRLLMLDEPSMGLAPIIVNEVFQIIQDLRQEGMTILLVEQNANKALKVADYGYVIDRGLIVKEGEAGSLRTDSH